MPSFFTDIKRGDLLVQFVIALPDSTCRAECINQQSLKPTATANLRYSDRTSLSDNKILKKMVGIVLNWKDVSCSKKGFLLEFFPPYSMSRYEPLTGGHNLHLSLFHVIFRAPLGVTWQLCESKHWLCLVSGFHRSANVFLLLLGC